VKAEDSRQQGGRGVPGYSDATRQRPRPKPYVLLLSAGKGVPQPHKTHMDHVEIYQLSSRLYADQRLLHDHEKDTTEEDA
jgi:hypothetical protein